MLLSDLLLSFSLNLQASVIGLLINVIRAEAGSFDCVNEVHHFRARNISFLKVGKLIFRLGYKMRKTYQPFS